MIMGNPWSRRGRIHALGHGRGDGLHAGCTCRRPRRCHPHRAVWTNAASAGILPTGSSGT